GNSVLIPNITAQQKNYLVARLKSYKSGEIKHPQMTVVAQMLSDKDIDDVSEWYSRIKITIADPEVEIAAPK
ncbi:MAG: c-type cytochrome, partial [Pelagibacteraceae bacterium]